MNLSLAYDGEFGFTATLTVNMEPKNSGMYANLFYYNEQTGKLSSSVLDRLIRMEMLNLPLHTHLITQSL